MSGIVKRPGEYEAKTTAGVLFRKDIYPVHVVLSKASSHSNVPKQVDFDGDVINMASGRYDTFQKSLRCAGCGIEGIYFAKERHVTHQKYHFNLYAINSMGHEVLMTKDHIVPKVLGGKNHISNYQTMCWPCNHKKGAHIQGDDKFGIAKAILEQGLDVDIRFELPSNYHKARSWKRTIENYCKFNAIPDQHTQAIILIGEKVFESLMKDNRVMREEREKVQRLLEICKSAGIKVNQKK